MFSMQDARAGTLSFASRNPAIKRVDLKIDTKQRMYHGEHDIIRVTCLAINHIPS